MKVSSSLAWTPEKDPVIPTLERKKQEGPGFKDSLATEFKPSLGNLNKESPASKLKEKKEG